MAVVALVAVADEPSGVVHRGRCAKDALGDDRMLMEQIAFAGRQLDAHVGRREGVGGILGLGGYQRDAVGGGDRKP